MLVLDIELLPDMLCLPSFPWRSGYISTNIIKLTTDTAQKKRRKYTHHSWLRNCAMCGIMTALPILFTNTYLSDKFLPMGQAFPPTWQWHTAYHQSDPLSCLENLLLEISTIPLSNHNVTFPLTMGFSLLTLPHGTVVYTNIFLLVIIKASKQEHIVYSALRHTKEPSSPFSSTLINNHTPKSFSSTHTTLAVVKSNADSQDPDLECPRLKNAVGQESSSSQNNQ